MKCRFLLTALCFCTALLAAESPLRNLDFSQKGADGKFTYWMQKGGAAEYKAENGTLTIKPQAPQGAKFLMQSPVEFQRGGKYRFTFERRGDAGMKSGLYIEYRDGDNKLRSINGNITPVKDAWVTQVLDFTMPETFSGAYMVIMVGAGGTGSCQFRNLKLECLGVTDFAALARMKAATTCFTTPFDGSKWRKLGAPNGTAEFANNTLTLKLNGAAGSVFYLKELKLKPGVKYEISAMVHLNKGKYGLYIEYTNAAGKRASINSNLYSSKGVAPFLVTLPVTMPEGARNITFILAA